MVTSRPIRRETGAIRGWELSPLRKEATERTSETLEAATGIGTGGPDTAGLLAAARLQAEEILNSARLQADRILFEAREQAVELQTSAYREAFADGQARGLEELGEKQRGLDALCIQIQSAYHRFCEEQMPALVGVASDAAERLLNEQLTVDPDRIVSIVRGALCQVTSSTAITVRLHPQDMRIVERGMLFTEETDSTGIRLIADASLQRGGCRIESDQGEVDATVEGRTTRLSRVLAADHAD